MFQFCFSILLTFFYKLGMFEVVFIVIFFIFIYFLIFRIESSLKEVLAVSDYIVNTLPSTPETVGLLNGDVLKLCTKVYLKYIYIYLFRLTLL